MPGDIRIAVIGLGYVGLALASSRHCPTIGFEIDSARIAESCQGLDKSVLETCDNFIVRVPKPIDSNDIPDRRQPREASRIVGAHLSVSGAVIYESTVSAIFRVVVA
jgi:UDP-N-acetyl-D-galactosamine dehydrogenase